MAAVPSGFGAWLKSPARYSTATIVGAADAWGEKATTSTNVSPLAYKTDADAEAVRQAQFLAGPIARDTHVVIGARSDLIGRVVRIIGPKLGYDDGVDVFVVAAVESETNGTTALTVLKRL